MTDPTITPAQPLPFNEWITRKGTTVPGPDEYRDYVDYANTELLRNGLYDDQLAAEIEQEVATLAAESGVTADLRARRPDQDFDLLTRRAIETGDEDMGNAVRTYQAVKGSRDIYDDEVEYQRKLEEARLAAEPFLDPERVNDARRAALDRGDLPFVVIDQGGDKPPLIQFGPAAADIQTDEDLAAAFDANPDLDRRFIGAVRQKIQPLPGFDAPAWVLDRQMDFQAAAARTKVTDTERYRLMVRDIANGNTDAFDRTLADLSTDPAFASFTPDERRNFLMDMAKMQGQPEVDPQNVAASLRTLSTGQVHIPDAVLFNKGYFDQALQAVPEGQHARIKTIREAHMEAVAPEMFKGIAEFSTFTKDDPSDPFRTVFVDFYEQAKAAGKSNGEILDEWMSNPDNHSKFWNRTRGLTMGAISAITDIPVSLAALAGSEGARDILVENQRRESARKQYANLFGDKLGIGYDAANLIAPVGVDFTLAAAAGPTGGATAVILAAKTGAKAVVKSALRRSLSAETKTLLSQFTRKAAARQATRQGLDTVTTPISTSAVLTLAGRDFAQTASRSATQATVLGTAFTRSAGSTYASLHATLSNERNADGTPRYTPEQVREIALGHGLTAGAITASVVGAFQFLGAAGVERLLSGGFTPAQARQIYARLQLNPAIAKQYGVSLESPEKMIESAVRNATTKFLRTGVEQGGEEFVDQMAQSVNEALATGERFDVVKATKDALYAGTLGFAMGAGMTGAQRLAGRPLGEDRLQLERRSTLLQLANKFDAHSPNTAAALRAAAAEPPPAPAQEDVPAPPAAGGPEQAPGDAGVAPAPEGQVTPEDDAPQTEIGKASGMTRSQIAALEEGTMLNVKFSSEAEIPEALKGNIVGRTTTTVNGVTTEEITVGIDPATLKEAEGVESDTRRKLREQLQAQYGMAPAAPLAPEAIERNQREIAANEEEIQKITARKGGTEKAQQGRLKKIEALQARNAELRQRSGLAEPEAPAAAEEETDPETQDIANEVEQTLAELPAPAGTPTESLPTDTPTSGDGGFVRDQSKPEQMTPAEFRALWDTSDFRREFPTYEGIQDHDIRIEDATETQKPVSAEAVDTYGIELPEGYVRQGDLYVFQPQATEVQQELPGTEQPRQRTLSGMRDAVNRRLDRMEEDGTGDPTRLTALLGRIEAKMLRDNAEGADAVRARYASAVPGQTVTADAPREVREVMDREFQEMLDAADNALPERAQEAVSRFTGFASIVREDPEAFGIMDVRDLEKAVSGQDAETAEQIEVAFKPIRENLRARFGDTITLYRAQKLEGEPSRQRYALSWTSNSDVSESFAGVRKIKEDFSEKDIADAEETFDNTGRFEIRKGYWLERKTDPEFGDYIAIMDRSVGGEVTDTPSVRAFLEGLNQDRQASRRINDKNASGIRKEDIPLDDVVWVTDRGGQMEFIVRTSPSRPLDFAPKPKDQEAPALKAIRAKDFQTSGNYEVQTPNGVRRIFRDPESGAWLDADRRAKGFPTSPFPYEFLGYTKKEALDALATPQTTVEGVVQNAPAELDITDIVEPPAPDEQIVANVAAAPAPELAIETPRIRNAVKRKLKAKGIDADGMTDVELAAQVTMGAATETAPTPPTPAPLQPGDPITFTANIPGVMTPTQGVVDSIKPDGSIVARVGKTKYPNAQIVGDERQQPELAETGDEVEWVTGRGDKATSIVGPIRFGKAEVDWFGLKNVPLEDLKIIRKSNRRLAREKKEREQLVETPSQGPTSPPKEKAFSKKEIQSLNTAKAPEGWTVKDDRQGVILVDSKGVEWRMETNFKDRSITLTRGADSYTFRKDTPPDDGGKQQPAVSNTPVARVGRTKYPNAQIVETAPVAPTPEEVQVAIETTLSAKDKEVAAAELGAAEWNADTATTFTRRMADWITSGIEASEKLAAMFARVAKAISKTAMALIAMVSITANTTTEANIQTIEVEEIAARPAGPSPSEIADVQRRAQGAADAAGRVAGSLRDAAVSAGQTIVNAVAPTVDRMMRQADFGKVKPSDNARKMADWIVKNQDNNGLVFTIADKSEGSLYFFSPEGKLIKKSPALFGSTPGDVHSPSRLSMTMEQIRNDRRQQITPAGRFETETARSNAYGQVVPIAKTGRNSRAAIHKVFTGRPQERRTERMDPQGAFKSDPLRTRVSLGCINVPDSTAKAAARMFEDGGVVYVMPDTEKGKSLFEGFAGLDAKFQPSVSNTPVARDLQRLGIQDGSAAFLRNVIERGPKEYRTIARILSAFTLPNPTLVDLPDANYAGAFVASTRQILINVARRGPRGPVDTVIHELIHAALEDSLRNPTDAQRKILNRLERIRQTVMKRAEALGNLEINYGLSSMDEFFTHFLTSPEFQRQIGAMTPKGQRNWVEVILDALRSLFSAKLKTEADKQIETIWNDMIRFTRSAAEEQTYGLSRMDQLRMQPANLRDLSRFKELTADLGETPTQADIDAWKTANPDKYAELQRMREAVLRDAGYNLKAWHGTDAEGAFNEFDPQRIGQNWRPELGRGFYFSPDRSFARAFGRAQMVETLLKIENPLEWTTANGEQAINFMMDLRLSDPFAIPDKAKAQGHDGIITGDGQIVVFDPNQIKSANPLNLDADGRLITPDRWADADTPDIRFQPIAGVPFIDGGRLTSRLNRSTGQPEESRIRFKTPLRLDDGTRISGFADDSKTVFYGYDENGEIFTLRAEYVGTDSNPKAQNIIDDGSELFDRLSQALDVFNQSRGIRFQPEPTPAQTPDTLRETAIGFLPDGFTLDDLDINFDQLAEDVSDTDPVNAEELIRSAVNYEVARVAAERELGDDYDPMFAETYYKLLTGNLPDADKAFYIGNPNAMERLIRFLTSALRRLTTAIELQFDRHTATAVNRISRALVDAERGFKVRPDYVMMGGDVTRMQPTDRFAEAEQKFNNQVNEYVTGNWPDDAEGQQQRGRAFIESWLERYRPFLAGESIGVNTFGRIPDGYRGDLRDRTGSRTSATVEPSGAVNIAFYDDMFRMMPGESESAALNFLARGVQEEVIHAAHLKSIVDRIGPSENYEDSVAEDLARTYSDILNSNFDFDDPTKTYRGLAVSISTYSRDPSISPERLAKPKIEGFQSADIGLQMHLVSEMARQAVQLRRSGGITEQEGNWWTTIKDWFAERLNALKRIAAYPGDMGALFERDIQAIEALLDKSEIRFQPILAPDNRISHFQDVYMDDPQTDADADTGEPRNWFQRMFVDRDDLARPLSKLFLNRRFSQKALESTLKNNARDFKLIQKKTPADLDLVSRALPSNRPTLTKADTDRINAEFDARLADLWTQESAAIAARENTRDEQLKASRSTFLRAGKSDPGKLGTWQTEYEKRDRQINSKAKTDIAAISADYRVRREQAMEQRKLATVQARLARADEMRRESDLALEELEKVNPDMAQWVIGSRMLIDDAQSVVKSVYGDSPQLQMLIDATRGAYMVRTYRIHQDPGYAKKFLTDPKYRKAYSQLVNYFEDQLVEQEKENIRRMLGEGNFEITEEEITNSRVKNKAERLKRLSKGENYNDADIEAIARAEVQDQAKTIAEDWIMGHGDSQTLVPQGSSSSIKVDFTRFLEKKDLDPILLEALGEITDPLFNTTRTIESLATIAQNRKFLAAYVRTGTKRGNLISKEEYESNPSKYRGWDTLVGKDERSPAYAPLSGYYAPPEHILAFDAVRKQNRTVPTSTAGKAFDRVNRIIMGSAGWSLAFVVMGNTASAVRNIFGGGLLASRQGIVAAMTAPFKQEGRAAYRAVYEAIFDPVSRKVNTDVLNEYIALGVILNGVDTNYLREMYEQYGSDQETLAAKIQELVAKGSKNAAEKFGKVREGTSAAGEYIGKIWEFTETLYNVVVFENELGKLREAGFGTEKQMKQEAADRMRMLLPSHSEQSQGVREFTKSPVAALVAPFIRFKTDMIRTTVNTYRLAIKDMKSGNPVLAKYGRERLASAFAVDAVLTAIVPQIMQALMGIGDDEDEAIRSAMPDYAKNSNFIYYLDRSTGELTTWDLTYLNPMSFVIDPFVNMYRAVASGDAEEIPAIAVQTVGQEFLGENVLAGLVIDVKRNKDQTTGKSIYLDTDTDAEKIRKSLAHVVGGAYTPAVGKVLYRTYQAAIRDQESDQFFFSPVGQAMNLFLPVKPRAQFVQDMAYRSFSETRAMNAQLWQTMSASRSPRPMDSSEIADMYQARVDGTLRVWSEFYNHAKGFEKLGLSRGEILAIARRAGLSQDRTRQVVTRGTTDRPVESAEALEKMRAIDPERVRVYLEQRDKTARNLNVTGK